MRCRDKRRMEQTSSIKMIIELHDGKDTCFGGGGDDTIFGKAGKD